MKYLLIGQPNAGKSSIYNKFTTAENIIHKVEGTTRDWHSSKIKGCEYSIIYDSPGVIIKDNKSSKIHFSKLFSDIDIFLYVIDLKNKNVVLDKESINELRKFNKRIILIINKDDNFEQNSQYLKSGFEKLFYISCAHNLGFEKLYEYFENNDQGKISSDKIDYSLAIYGKPNAGKSTLANSLLGYERIITSNLAGTTSDAVEAIYKYNNKKFKLIDTAGIFKKNKIDNKSINYEAIRKSLNLKDIIDLSLVLIDCTEGFDTQIKKILKILFNQSKSIIIVFNKIDKITNQNKFIKETKLIVKETFAQIKNITILFISANNKKNVIQLKNIIFNKSQVKNKIISTSKLNSLLKKLALDHPHPLVNGKSINFKYAVQISSSPAVIKIFSNFPKHIKKSYKNYLINKIIENFDITDSKVNLIFSASKNPFY
tara:strand:- start:3322 stop:4608 length:1287 start_codon:yes stop_codon:yes gene_type:complete